jgi:5-methyltetrahydrofolate--homocysteine methyltransferase
MTNLINDLECGRILLFDGARGTALNKKGLTFGEETNLAHVNHPTIVTDLAKEYIEAGSDILTTIVVKKSMKSTTKLQDY